MHHHHRDTVILYHDKCPDGFGAAYAAWKKFGDSAEYIPIKHGSLAPEKMEGRTIYMVDFCYPKEIMNELATKAASLTVLDHHEGVRDIAAAFPGVFDSNKSGATIAWEYFHPGVAVPHLLSYLEDDDLYRFQIPETRDVLSYVLVYPYDFEKWDALKTTLEDPQTREELLVKARTYSEYFLLLGNLSIAGAKLVQFEGYECYFAVSHPLMTMKSYVGKELAHKNPPFALVVTAHPDGFGVSIRGDGSVDVSKIAEKYGGSGHTNSSGFFIPLDTPVPWVEVKTV